LEFRVDRYVKVEQPAIAPAQLGCIAAATGLGHGLLLFRVAVRLEGNLDLCGSPAHAAGFAIEQFGRGVQFQALSSGRQIMLPHPVVQTGEQDLQIEHDLVFCQVPFSALAGGIDGVARRLAVSQFLR